MFAWVITILGISAFLGSFTYMMLSGWNHSDGYKVLFWATIIAGSLVSVAAIGAGWVEIGNGGFGNLLLMLGQGSVFLSTFTRVSNLRRFE